ncbi:amidohydrolase [Schizopora paradoxa]|uniref:Amidohydrolase n=1 Tax=Schizopora paradoxa TaxID=27342 RepID=A0A0H2SN83_9AGAM|nr:amidohydrolase [Schizopora paradoxa]
MCTFDVSCTGCFCWLNLNRGRQKGWRTRRAEREKDESPSEKKSTVPTSDESKPQVDFNSYEDVESPSPPSYLEFLEGEGTDSVYRPEVLETITNTIGDLSQELRTLSVGIHDHPELGFEEKYAHDKLTEFMREHGFEVTPHYASLDTAWRAKFVHGKGGRVLGVNSEMDALPGVGHACGHNLIAAGGVGVALAVKAAMVKHNVNGKIILLGTPAEEGGGGKVLLIQRGTYKEMDLCVMSHPSTGSPRSTTLGSSLALQSISVEYFGHTAHAAAAPWEGQNALDAAHLAYSGVSVLRQQIKPDHRVHGVIEGKDWAPNVIPDYAKLRYYVRAPSWQEVEALRERVKNCFVAAATATSCRYEIHEGLPHYDLKQNTGLGVGYAAAAKQVGLELVPAEARASTDFGNVTYELPSLHPRYAIPTEPNGGNHTPQFTASARTVEAHKAMLEVVKALSLTAFRALDDDAFYAKAREAFEREKSAEKNECPA